MIGLVLWLGAVFVSLEARAGGGGAPFLVFDASAEGLPREEIRAAVERELGGPLPTSSESASGELTILMDSERRLVIRYRTPSGAVERLNWLQKKRFRKARCHFLIVARSYVPSKAWRAMRVMNDGAKPKRSVQ